MQTPFQGSSFWGISLVYHSAKRNMSTPRVSEEVHMVPQHHQPTLIARRKSLCICKDDCKSVRSFSETNFISGSAVADKVQVRDRSVRGKLVSSAHVVHLCAFSCWVFSLTQYGFWVARCRVRVRGYFGASQAQKLVCRWKRVSRSSVSLAHHWRILTTRRLLGCFVSCFQLDTL